MHNKSIPSPERVNEITARANRELAMTGRYCVYMWGDLATIASKKLIVDGLDETLARWIAASLAQTHQRLCGVGQGGYGRTEFRPIIDGQPVDLSESIDKAAKDFTFEQLRRYRDQINLVMKLNHDLAQWTRESKRLGWMEISSDLSAVHEKLRWQIEMFPNNQPFVSVEAAANAVLPIEWQQAERPANPGRGQATEERG